MSVIQITHAYQTTPRSPPLPRVVSRTNMLTREKRSLGSHLLTVATGFLANRKQVVS